MPRILTTVAVGLFAATATAQTSQNFDVLIPTGSNDGAFALVDKDKDGKYTTAGEAWDYVKALRDTSPRNYVLMGKKIFFTDTGRDQIVWIEDVNGDGLIDAATERNVFYDLAGIGGLTPGFITQGANGWLWWINDGGTGEGIYRSKDLNNDGDAEDAGETIPVLTESMTKVKIANTPVTTAANKNALPDLSVTEIDSIIFDSKHGTYGRYIVEDEWSDQTLAFEDKNNDGDFADAGECYLFCALYDGARTTRIDGDVNPDVKSAKLPVANEIRNHALSYLSTKTTYYLMSADTTPLNPDACKIFRGIDNNNDGDINDAGEVTIYWDGSLNSTGATKGYNFVVGMSIDIAGRLFVSAEWDATVDSERLIMLVDKNNDGDCNDAGETEVLWNLGTDRTHYTPAIFPPGTLKPLKTATTLAEISYYGDATCRTSLSATSLHNIQFGRSTTTSGSASSKAPVIGNTKWLIRTWGAAPTANGAYAVGLVKNANGVPLGNGTCKVYQDWLLTVLNFTTTAAGDHDQLVPIPNDKSLLGLWSYWQSIVIDGTAPGGLGFTLSDAFQMKVGDWSYTR